MNKCIRMGITASNLSFGKENRLFYGRKLCFMAPLTRRRKKNEISDRKTADLPPQMTNLNAVIP